MSEMNLKDLTGKTIATATVMKKPETDDTGWLKLTFTDGTSCVVVAGYGGWTSRSEDEYPTLIWVEDEVEGLIPE